MGSERHPVDSLTPRELEILRLVAVGLSNRDIAEELVVAPETIRWYTKQIYSKLGISGRVQAINRARELGLLDDALAHNEETVPPSAQRPSHSLPAPTTPFVGRGREVTDVKRLLQAARLLTLTGVGGTGKTRLALRVASDVLDVFADGVYFVDLAPLSDPALVSKAIAAVLGVVENPTEPLPDTLKRVLAGRGMLLVIDNFEHVIEAAPVVSDLLAASPRLKALVTSREALRLSGEQEYPVSPLSLPSADVVSIQEVTASEAGTLFVQRAQMTQPHFALSTDNAPTVAQICARLDGLPLAIELAAARCKLLTPQALLERLDSRLTALAGGARDAPVRQQTLRNTIEWSYNLLDEDEKALFARLAVFRGGRSLEAIEVVCGHELSIDVLDGLASLVDKSLVQQKETADGEPRFVMLETIHEYAWERLEVSGEADAMRQRHAEYFVALAERAEPELRLAQQAHWFHLLETEHENMRTVLEWSLDGGDVTLGVRLSGALHQFWFGYGHHVEGYNWTQQLFGRLNETPEKYHANFLRCAGEMASFRDIEVAKSLFTRALDVSRKLGEHFHSAGALLGLSLTMMDDTEKAISLVQESLTLFSELKHKPGIAHCLTLLGEIYRHSGDDISARAAYEESLALSLEIGDTRRTYVVFADLAVLDHHEGNHERAVDFICRALRLCREMNNRKDMARGIELFAGCIGALGQAERAAFFFGAADVAISPMGALHEPVDKPEYDRNLANVRAQLDKATFEAAWAEGRKMSLEQAVAEALSETS